MLPDIEFSSFKPTTKRHEILFKSINFGSEDANFNKLGSLSFYPRENDKIGVLMSQERIYKGPIKNFAVNHKLKQMTDRYKRFKEIKKLSPNKYLPKI